MTVEDILIGPARVLRAPVGESYPSETDVPYGGDWGGNWEDMGFTEEGTPVSWNNEIETVEVGAQQTTLILKRVRTKEKLTVETTLIEITADNLEVALEGTVTETAAGPTQKPYKKLQGGGQRLPNTYSWSIEGVRVDDDGNEQPVRLFVHKGDATIGGALQFGKATPTGIALRIEALANLSKAVGKQYYDMDIVTGPTTS